MSKLELSSILEEFSITELKFQEWKKYLLLELSKEQQTKLIKSLEKSGSIIKAGFIELEEKVNDLNELKPKIIAYLKKTLQTLPIQKTRKIKFSINIQTSTITIRKQLNSIIKKSIYQTSSDLLFESKIRSPKKETSELSPYQFFKENFHKRGIEITCLVIKSTIFIGHLKWVTNPLKDIKQDEERPVRLFTHGTSIKLARTLVNLSKIQEGDVLFDPFCGTGTILLEGLKQNLQAIGIDRDPKSVRASKANLNHFSMKFPSKERMKDKWSIYLLDSQNLNEVIDIKIGGLVTEPYLGPFIKELPTKEKAKDTMTMLEKLYTKVLQKSVEYLKTGHRVILIIPEYRYSQDYSIYPDYQKIAKNCKLEFQTKSTLFNVKLPVQIGRKHNIINRKLVIYTK
ncbi:MAG: hypothetical protein HGN29_12815 [Asgard group archaeon]|nr:hypothetical protein [Asgard group archaeon]